LNGQAQKQNVEELVDGILEFEMYIDGQKVEQIKMPTSFTTRRHEVAWKYDLPEGKHQVKLKLLNPQEGYQVRVDNLLVYSSLKPANTWKTN